MEESKITSISEEKFLDTKFVGSKVETVVQRYVNQRLQFWKIPNCFGFLCYSRICSEWRVSLSVSKRNFSLSLDWNSFHNEWQNFTLKIEEKQSMINQKLSIVQSSIHFDEQSFGIRILQKKYELLPGLKSGGRRIRKSFASCDCELFLVLIFWRLVVGWNAERIFNYQ